MIIRKGQNPVSERDEVSVKSKCAFQKREREKKIYTASRPQKGSVIVNESNDLCLQSMIL